MTQQFKEFKIGDLLDINRGDVKNQKDLKFVENNGINFIAQNNLNNGLVGKVKLENYKKFNKGCIVIGRQTGVVYYQKEDFITTDGVLVCNFKEDLGVSNLSNLYIISHINKFMVNFGYSNTVSASKLREISLNLPVTSDGELDFDYMDNYIKGIEQKYILNLRYSLNNKIANLLELTQKTEDNISVEHVQVLKEKIRLDYSQKEFKEFKVGDIFEVKTGGRVVKSAQIKGNIPYITAVSTNNGIDTYISNPKFIDENIITVSFLGDVFYHPYKLGYKDGTCGLKLINNMYQSAYVYIYFTSLLKKVAKQLGSYDKGLIKSDIERISLLLPVTFDGGIDYEFMGNYVRSLESVHIHDFRVCEEERIGLIEGLLV